MHPALTHTEASLSIIISDQIILQFNATGTCLFIKCEIFIFRILTGCLRTT